MLASARSISIDVWRGPCLATRLAAVRGQLHRRAPAGRRLGPAARVALAAGEGPAAVLLAAAAGGTAMAA